MTKLLILAILIFNCLASADDTNEKQKRKPAAVPLDENIRTYRVKSGAYNDGYAEKWVDCGAGAVCYVTTNGISCVKTQDSSCKSF